MKVAQAQIKAIKAGEQKQKKKEDELVRILTQFIKNLESHPENSDFLYHISKLLSFNCPAAFILGILLLNFPELQVQTGLTLATFEEAMKAGALDSETLPDLYISGKTLTPAMRVALDSWIRELIDIAVENRHKIISTSLNHQKNEWDPAIADFMVFSLERYLSLYDVRLETAGLREFIAFCLKGILENVKKDFDLLK